MVGGALDTTYLILWRSDAFAFASALALAVAFGNALALAFPLAAVLVFVTGGKVGVAAAASASTVNRFKHEASNRPFRKNNFSIDHIHLD